MHPILLRIGGFDIATYGPLIAMGVLLGVAVAVRRAHTVGVAPELILDLTFWCVILGFVGARVFFIVGDPDGFAAQPWRYIFSRQGYVFFGGLLFALPFALWFLRRKRADIWQVGDIVAPSIPLGHAFGRTGCFFAGCCFGRICPPGWESWGVRFPTVFDPETGELLFGFAYDYHQRAGLLPPEATHSLPVFPVQLYEAGANVLIFLGLMWLWRRRRFRGQIFTSYLAAYGATRFLLEFLRGDYADPVLSGLLRRGQVSQVICLGAIGAAVVIWLRRRQTPLEVAEAPEPAQAPAQSGGKKPRRQEKKKRHRRR